MLSMDRRRAFGLWYFVAIAAHFAFYFNHISYDVLESSIGTLVPFSRAQSMGMLMYVAPLLSALPFAAGFCADWNSGFASPAAVRAGKDHYLFSKICACALSGGLVPAIATLLFLAFLNLTYPAATMNRLASVLQTLSLGVSYPHNLSYLVLILMQLLAGAFWAMTGLAFSAFCPNPLLTLCAPLAVHLLSAIICDWFHLPLWLNLPLLQDCAVGMDPLLTLACGALVFSALTLILATIFTARAKRRLAYE